MADTARCAAMDALTGACPDAGPARDNEAARRFATVTERIERYLAGRVNAKLRDHRLTKAAELVEASVDETLAYYQFPEEH